MNIKKVIKSHGLTSDEVAKRIGVAKTTFSTTINGNPTVKVLERIANAIGCDVKEFFEKDEGSVNGFVEYGGKVHRIKSVADVEQLLAEMKA